MKNGSENLSPAAENALRETIVALSPPKTVEEVKDLLDLTEKGLVRNTVSNAELILSYDPLLRESIRYNELTQRVDVVKPMGWERGSTGPALTDNDIFNFHLYCDRTYGITAKALVEEAVSIVTSMKPASAFSVNIADIFQNKACNIERDIDDCTVTMLEDTLVHSNHFLHKEGKSDACSRFRYQKPTELLKTGMYPKEILEYRSDIYDQSVRLRDPNNEGKGITVANMTWDPVTCTLCIDDVLDGTSLEFVLQ